MPSEKFQKLKVIARRPLKIAKHTSLAR